MIEIEIRNKSPFLVPKYETPGSSGMDIRAFLGDSYFITIEPGKRALIPTGLYFGLPEGYELQVRPRSGLAFREGITVLNSPGTIDCDYTGELKIIVINLGEHPVTINNGDRIAQIVLANVPKISWIDKEELTKITDRSDGGFGHTGKL